MEKIKSSAFGNCSSLKGVIFTEYNSQLQDITAIKEITIPETVQKIGSGAFSGNQLNKVVFLGDPGKMIIYRDAFPGNVKRVYSNDSKE